jgi:STE24 endopeptidase
MIDSPAAVFSPAFSALFLACLVLVTAFRLWLCARQIRHVRAHQGRVPAPFDENISLAAHQRAAAYTVARMRLAATEGLVSALLLWALTFGGGIAWIEAASAQVRPAGSISQGLLMFGAVGLVQLLAEAPFTLYRTFVLEARFGFNTTTARVFASDWIKTLLLSVLIFAPVLAGVLWLMQSRSGLWWLQVWVFWSALNLFLMWAYPQWIAPIFNTFTPLKDETLKARIETLLDRCGFKAQGVWVMDGSRRSSHGNAYFTGMGRAKRIVFFDTLLNRLQPDEIEAVLAHELGHYRHHHLIQRILLNFAGSLMVLWGLAMLLDAPWFYQGLGLETASVAGGLLLFMLAMPVFFYPVAPCLRVWSRHHEFQADAFAARMSSGAALQSALLKLYRDNAATLTPDPLYSAMNDSHPPAALRIAHLRS